MLVRMSTLVATTLAICQCLATSTAASTSSADQEIAEGFTTGAWTRLDANNYTIASPCDAQEWNFSQNKASALWLYFSTVDLAEGAKLVVSASNGSYAQTLKPQSSGVITPPIVGDALTVRFEPSSDGCTSSHSSSNSNITFDLLGYEQLETSDEEREICGAEDTMKNVVCFASGSQEDQTKVTMSRAVMRTQRVRDDDAIVTCTAWLWGSQGHIVTNNHCFSNQEMVDAAQFEFDVQATECDIDCAFATCPVSRTLAGKDSVQFITSDPTLDFAVLQITTDAQGIVDEYGYLQLSSTAPTSGEVIYLPQHPKGGGKKIAKTDDDADSTGATISSTDYEVTVSGETYSNLLSYAADTDTGSSGSPVLSSANNTVVGLHRIGDCDNAATPSDQLVTALLSVVSDNDGYSG